MDEIPVNFFDDMPQELNDIISRMSDDQLFRCFICDDPDPILDRLIIEEFNPKFQRWLSEKIKSLQNSDKSKKKEAMYEAFNKGKIDYLTSKQFEIAQLLGKGLSNDEMSQYMEISKKTVETHLNHLYFSLRLDNEPNSRKYFMAYKILRELKIID